MKKFYYFDGYHGGREGHMPLGAFKSILDFLITHPKWRVNLDIEPESWKLLKYRDPDTFYKLREMIVAQNPRVEIVNEAYSQPLACGLNGESVIRNFVYGRETLKKTLGEVPIENFASQEPTLTSCLPQILLSLGYKQASLFNSTIFAGYSQGFNQSVVSWRGNDGSTLPAVARYAVDEVVKHTNNGHSWWSMESLYASAAYVEKCERAGFVHAAAMHLHDLGNNAEFSPEAMRDGADKSYVEYRTFREYFAGYPAAALPTVFGQEIFRVSLPWSEMRLSELLGVTRNYEYGMLTLERLNAVAALYFQTNEETRISDCWKQLLLCMHHDAWVCVKHKFSESMRHQRFALENGFLEATMALKERMTDDLCKEMTVSVFNPLGKKTRRLIAVALALSADGVDYEVCDGENTIESDTFAVTNDGMKNKSKRELVFYADLESLKFHTFTVKPLLFARARSGMIRQTDDTVALENERVKVVIDLKKGGVISSYYDKKDGYEYVKTGGCFHELKGFFESQNRFVSNTENPAEAEIVRNGATSGTVRVRMKIADAVAIAEYTLYKESGYLDVTTTLAFAKDTKVGDPYKTDDWYDTHRSFYDARYALNAYFSTAFEQKRLDKQCAFDVCESKEETTRYNDVRSIKHNIAVNWLDVTDGEKGLCLFTDRTTAYVKEKTDEVGLSLAWGTDCSCIWGADLSEERKYVSYRIYPHASTWEVANLWWESEIYNHEPVCFVGRVKTETESPVEICTDGVELSALFTEDGKYYLRLFNHGREERACVRLGEAFKGLVPCAHDKTENGDLILKESGVAICFIPRFAVRTYRLKT